MTTQAQERDDRLVRELYETADEIADDELRDRQYHAITQGLEAWSPTGARARREPEHLAFRLPALSDVR